MDTPGGSYTPPPPPFPPPPSGTPPAGGELVYPTDPPKEPVLMLVLNLIVGGCLGYFLVGQKMKGIVALIAWVLGWASCGIVSAIVAITAAIDVYLQSLQLQAGHPVAQWTFFNDHK
ncbi:MAG TPA: hypothetical protein VKH35_13335 [Thermoanaerobaculia bacterium]|nr:hypothetical protein [Thermoanaerobaculia bacterium]